MAKCADFIRDKNLVWIENLLTHCEVCVHSTGDMHSDCKINGINNETSIIHKPFYGNSKVVRVFK